MLSSFLKWLSSNISYSLIFIKNFASWLNLSLHPSPKLNISVAGPPDWCFCIRICYSIPNRVSYVLLIAWSDHRFAIIWNSENTPDSKLLPSFSWLNLPNTSSNSYLYHLIESALLYIIAILTPKILLYFSLEFSSLLRIILFIDLFDS